MNETILKWVATLLRGYAEKFKISNPYLYAWVSFIVQSLVYGVGLLLAWEVGEESNLLSEAAEKVFLIVEVVLVFILNGLGLKTPPQTVEQAQQTIDALVAYKDTLEK